MARVKKKLYPTFGKKPELPDGVEVIAHLRDGTLFTGEAMGSRKLRWSWTDYYSDNKQHLKDIMYFEIA